MSREETAPPEGMSRSKRVWWAFSVLLALELLGLMSLVIGPARFNVILSDSVPLLEFRLLQVAQALPTSVITTTQQPPFPTLLELARAGEVGAAQAYFADEVSTTTWLSGQSSRVDGHSSEMTAWLVGIAPHMRIVSERLDPTNDETTETVWATSDNLKQFGIESYELVFRVRSRAGKVSSITTFSDPSVVERMQTMLGPQALERGPGTFGEALAISSMLLPVIAGVYLLVAGSAKRWLGLLALSVPVIALVAAVLVSLDDLSQNDIGRMLPNRVAYLTHAELARELASLSLPRLAAIQWIKAASHAGAPAEVARAAEGIAQARSSDNTLDSLACTMAGHASAPVQQALIQAGAVCI